MVRGDLSLSGLVRVSVKDAPTIHVCVYTIATGVAVRAHLNLKRGHPLTSVCPALHGDTTERGQGAHIQLHVLPDRIMQ